jgi:hypothetical protein
MPAFCRDASLIARPPYTVWLPISTVVIDARLGRAVAAVRFTIYIIYPRPKRAINFPPAIRGVLRILNTFRSIEPKQDSPCPSIHP